MLAIRAGRYWTLSSQAAEPDGVALVARVEIAEIDRSAGLGLELALDEQERRPDRHAQSCCQLVVCRLSRDRLVPLVQPQARRPIQQLGDRPGPKLVEIDEPGDVDRQIVGDRRKRDTLDLGSKPSDPDHWRADRDAQALGDLRWRGDLVTLDVEGLAGLPEQQDVLKKSVQRDRHPLLDVGRDKCAACPLTVDETLLVQG